MTVLTEALLCFLGAAIIFFCGAWMAFGLEGAEKPRTYKLGFEECKVTVLRKLFCYREYMTEHEFSDALKIVRELLSTGVYLRRKKK